MHLSIRHKLFLTIALVVIVFVAIVNFLVFGLLDDVIEHHVVESIESSVGAYTRFDAAQEDILLLKAAAMSEVAHLKATLAIDNVDHLTVRYAASSLSEIGEFPLTLILDPEGRLLTDLNELGVMDAEISGLEADAISSAQNGYSYSDVWVHAGIAYRIAIAPIVSGDWLVGLIVVGEPVVTPENIVALEELVSVGVGVSIRSEVVYPNEDQANTVVRQLLGSQTPSSGENRIGDIVRFQSLSSGSYYSAELKLGPAGSIVMYASEESASQSVAAIRKWIWIVTFLSLLLAMLASYRLASRISRPIRSLAAAAEAYGRDQSASLIEVNAVSSDEVGLLTQSFRTMAESLNRNQAVLLESKEAAEASSRAKSAFLATMSHEIRTPLNGVIGTASLLERTKLTPKQAEYCTTITSSSHALLNMLNGVLDYSKADVGQLVLSEVPHNLTELLSQKLNQYKDAAIAKGVVFESNLNIEPDLWVSVDGTRLHQVLDNLISNGIKFTSQGKVVLTVDCVVTTNTSAELRFSVVDTGIGIEANDVDHIFESFVQADDAMSRQYGGSGLGLSISQQLVQLMGSSINVASMPTVGSTFWFTLRLATASEAVDQQPDLVVHQVAAEGLQYCSFPGLTALVVEDNVVNQVVAGEWLECLGLKVLFAGNGQEAVDCFKTNSPDVVFMDCQMPVMDGYEATTQMRSYESEIDCQRTPIIALTANSFKEDRDRCKSSGMDEFVSKPFTYEDLVRALSLWFEPESVSTPVDEVESPSAQRYPSQLNELRLEQLRATGGMGLLLRVVRVYLEETPAIVKALRTAIKLDNCNDVRDLAHRLKSSSASLGADKLAHICQDLESAGGSGDLDQCAYDGVALDAAYQQVKLALLSIASQDETVLEREQIEVSGEQHRILIVDDDPTFRITLTEVLSGAGFSTSQVASGAQALVYADKYRPDIVLMDALMPHIDGFETCQKFQASPRLRSIPILMLTGLNDQASIDRAFECGATGFLTKPIEYPLLAHHVRFVVRASEDAEQLREHQLRLSIANRMARLGYWIWNSRAEHLTVSPELMTICELTNAGSMSLNDLAALIHEDDRASFLQDVHKILADQCALDSEFRLWTRSGELIAINQHMEVSHTFESEAVITATMQDVTKLRSTEDRVRWLAYYDQLTGLANRSYLHEHLGSMIKSARRRKEGFAVLFLDLDGFKLVNDSLGHDQGDEMLKAVAGRLKDSLRENDFLARLGGDEFCMILEGAGEEANISLVASRCLAAVEAPFELSSQIVKPRVSIGIARYPSDGEDTHALLRAADAAMYRAKAMGKHRFEFFNEAMTLQATERLAIGQELRGAITNNQFELHYQPQVSLSTGRVERYEALIRWQHPERGLVPPNEFIPELERMGMIDEVGEWVVRQACQQVSLWRDLGLGDARVSVNISPGHFRNSSLIAVVQSSLDEFELQPESLELEVTESAIQNSREAVEVFEALNGIGVRLAIDDFGAGYSSLGSLKDLPIHSLKIDRVFIRDLMNNPKDAVLLGTIMTLAHALRFTVVAEGAEHLEQIRILAGLQCDLVQGYFFSRPVPAASIPALHRKSYLPTFESEAGAA